MGKKSKKKDRKDGRERRAAAGESATTVARPQVAERSLCKWTAEDIEQHLPVLAELVDEPRYVCRKCARAARRKKNLCKPVPLT